MRLFRARFLLLMFVLSGNKYKNVGFYFIQILMGIAEIFFKNWSYLKKRVVNVIEGVNCEHRKFPLRMYTLEYCIENPVKHIP